MYLNRALENREEYMLPFFRWFVEEVNGILVLGFE